MADPLLYSLLKEFAIENRKKTTEAEFILWNYLKGNTFGAHFRRQHIIGKFIADFVCLSRKLIIEVDGKYHQLPEQQITDEERTSWLKSKGFTVIRFKNEQIVADTNVVLETINAYIINDQNK